MSETFHRFATRRAYREACDAAGWPRDQSNDPVPPQGVTLDVIGELADPPTEVGGILVAGEVDRRWHVNAIWQDYPMPQEFADAELILEEPTRTFSDREPAEKIKRIRKRFTDTKRDRPDDVRLRPARVRDRP